jgi:hypothetical protein
MKIAQADVKNWRLTIDIMTGIIFINKNAAPEYPGQNNLI